MACSPSNEPSRRGFVRTRRRASGRQVGRPRASAGRAVTHLRVELARSHEGLSASVRTSVRLIPRSAARPCAATHSSSRQRNDRRGVSRDVSNTVYCTVPDVPRPQCDGHPPAYERKCALGLLAAMAEARRAVEGRGRPFRPVCGFDLADGPAAVAPFTATRA
jgi:hypothetical protein